MDRAQAPYGRLDSAYTTLGPAGAGVYRTGTPRDNYSTTAKVKPNTGAIGTHNPRHDDHRPLPLDTPPHPRRPLVWASRVQLGQPSPGGRARRSVLSGASTVRRVSWRAFRAPAAGLLPGDKRLFSEAPVPRPARPSAMSHRWKSHSRRAKGSTTTAPPQRARLSACRHTQYPWMVVPPALRANYVR